ncbi:hypothetical protein AYX14_06610 [Cryptococcus neoformans]|nr:hypothetical protein AYX14_06610 [Cryptococcus neoformans var. grubii]
MPTRNSPFFGRRILKAKNVQSQMISTTSKIVFKCCCQAISHAWIDIFHIWISRTSVSRVIGIIPLNTLKPVAMRKSINWGKMMFVCSTAATSDPTLPLVHPCLPSSKPSPLILSFHLVRNW